MKISTKQQEALDKLGTQQLNLTEWKALGVNQHTIDALLRKGLVVRHQETEFKDHYKGPVGRWRTYTKA